MSQILALAGLILIVSSIIFIFFRRSSINKNVKGFYQRNNFSDVNSLPANITQLLPNEYLTAKQGSITINNQRIHFYWIESVSERTHNLIKTNNPAHLHYLTIVFPPASISQEFMQRAVNSVNSSMKILNWETDTIILAKQLNDGSFAIKRRNLETEENYEKQLAWLRTNVF